MVHLTLRRVGGFALWATLGVGSFAILGWALLYGYRSPAVASYVLPVVAVALWLTTGARSIQRVVLSALLRPGRERDGIQRASRRSLMYSGVGLCALAGLLLFGLPGYLRTAAAVPLACLPIALMATDDLTLGVPKVTLWARWLRGEVAEEGLGGDTWHVATGAGKVAIAAIAAFFLISIALAGTVVSVCLYRLGPG